MSTFALAVAALIALAVAMVLLLPRLWYRSGRAETNADWLILRQRSSKVIRNLSSRMRHSVCWRREMCRRMR